VPGTPAFLEEVADRLREMACAAPDISWELRRFAEDIEELILGTPISEDWPE
jgi:hypothetical protein